MIGVERVNISLYRFRSCFYEYVYFISFSSEFFDEEVSSIDIFFSFFLNRNFLEMLVSWLIFKVDCFSFYVLIVWTIVSYVVLREILNMMFLNDRLFL